MDSTFGGLDLVGASGFEFEAVANRVVGFRGFGALL